ncbi:GroES-like protein [Wolfiporia cocos MD-104 SS10]|uniref:GroES-like protein n=1 Tax=Wolfiporia cocos (strain MD-104) TaxID=742152 RepID=A0A2H3JFG7_WOLCO|nr:GroES-like protein [Wolfiporia cocos MD-104 SS10]
MRAIITQLNKTVALEEVPVPTIADDEILVKTVAAAQNPTDWQYVYRVTNVGTIVGCDWSGHVVQVGQSVTTHAVGDHVAGFTHGSYYTDRGAYAEYVKASADLAWKVPPGTFSHEEAATMGCAFWTAVQGLFHPTRLGLVEPPNKVSKEEWLFVYGGSSSVGMFALQLAHVAGYKVVTVASPRNHELCKSLGADVVFDYKDPDVIAKIKDATHDSLHYAFDTICNLQTQSLTVNCFAPGPGKMVTIQPVEESAQVLREDVKARFTLIYTSLGRSFDFLGLHYPASPQDRAHMASFLRKVPELVSSVALKPNPVMVWEGGLNGVNDGLKFMKEGKNSGEKIVYRV